MLEGKRIGAIILMAGEGRRLGGETPKQFLMLAGKKVYLHTVEAFKKIGLFDEIVLVCPPDWLTAVQQETGLTVTAGGTTRQESSRAGLSAFAKQPDIVVIHDGVRPFVSERILRDNVEGALRWGAVDTCIPSADTLVYVPDGKQIESIPKRASFMRGQTPQSFSYERIVKAHSQAAREGLQATDDCRLLLDLGLPVGIVQGEEFNLKITSELDLFLAEQVFRLRKEGKPIAKTTLAGKVYAVVGGSGGIGQAICQLLEREGAHPVVLSRSSALPVDLREPASIEKAFERLHEMHGPVDGLINCAGLLVVKPLARMSLGEIEEVLAVNLQGLILCCQQARIRAGGHIVNFASSSFSRGRSESGVYSSAKAGVVNFTQSLAEERPDLRVWAVVPQRTRTAMRQEHFPQEQPSSLLEPEAVASKVLELLKDPDQSGLISDIRKI